GDGGDPAGSGGLQPSHGTVEARRPGAAPAHGHGRPGAGGEPLAVAPGAGSRAVRLDRSRHGAALVDRRGRAPEPDLPGTPRSRLRHALLASGGARHESRSRRALRRHFGGYGVVAPGLRGMARPRAARDPALSGRHPPALLAHSSAQALAGGLPAAAVSPENLKSDSISPDRRTTRARGSLP